MKRMCPFLVFVFLFGLVNISLAAAEPEIISCLAEKDGVEKFEKFELTVKFKANYKNPFDPADIDLSAVFISPAGKKYKIPGFLYSANFKDGEFLNPLWKIRFTPFKEGQWQYYVLLKSRKSRAKSKLKQFDCLYSDSNGFLRVSQASHYYFEFQDGGFFFPIGFNVCWVIGAVEYKFNEYYQLIGQNGGNWSRLWMPSWGLALEWKKGKKYPGLGKYNLTNALLLDTVLDLARKHGLYIQLVINNHGQLSCATNAEWENNPYNVENGGPCQVPEDFFTNPRARKIFKNRLRYIIARYGHSPHIFAWELWNEVDLTDDFNEARVEKWHKEMIGFIKQFDPYPHMITTSFARPLNYNLWKLKDINYTQVHMFSDTLIEEVFFWAEEFKQRYPKPVLISEAGSTAKDGIYERREDSQGIRFINALWSSACSVASGTAMYWWWDNYIKPNHLSKYLKPIANFMAGEDRRPQVLKKLKAQVLSPAEHTGTLSFTPFLDWQASEADEFLVANDGTISNIEKLSRFFQGNSHNDMKVTPTFYVDYPEGGYFIVNIDMISQSGAGIKIWLDDTLKTKYNFKPGGSYRVVDESFFIEVPFGKHKIKIDNNGSDWFRIRNITLTDYAVPLMVKGLQTEDRAYIWFKNRNNTIDNFKKRMRFPILKDAKVKIKDLKNGIYKIEFWNVYTGKIIQQRELCAKDKELILELPPFVREMACKIRPEDKKE